MAADIRNADMPIYTKTGDNGTTSLYGGIRVSKTNPSITAYGSIDELSSFLGLIIAKITPGQDKKFITGIQKDLYIIMSFLAGAKVQTKPLSGKIEKMERRIDEIENTLPELTHFILPQGTELTSLTHIARSVCRRAERETVLYFNTHTGKKEPVILRYLNRLSDFLFDLARLYNKNEVIVSV